MPVPLSRRPLGVTAAALWRLRVGVACAIPAIRGWDGRSIPFRKCVVNILCSYAIYVVLVPKKSLQIDQSSLKVLQESYLVSVGPHGRISRESKMVNDLPDYYRHGTGVFRIPIPRDCSKSIDFTGPLPKSAVSNGRTIGIREIDSFRTISCGIGLTSCTNNVPIVRSPFSSPWRYLLSIVYLSNLKHLGFLGKDFKETYSINLKKLRFHSPRSAA